MKGNFEIKQFNLYHSFFIFMFIVYLFFADYIFLDIIHVSGEQNLERATLPKIHGKINYWIPEVQFRRTSWKNMVYIGGGIIKENVQQNEKLKINIILKNTTKDDEIYKVYTELLTVEELRNSVVDFQTLFSIHKLKNDGVYRMGILIENCCEKSFNWTDNYLEKNGDEIVIKRLNSFISSQTNIDISNLESFRAQSGIDKIEISTAEETDVLKIYGWAVVDGKESKLQKGYVVLKDTKGNRVVYDTFPFSSPAVADIFKSDLYMESGIYAAIPIIDIADGEYEVYIYTENDGLYEMKVNKTIIISGDREKVNIKDINVFISNETKLNFNNIKSRKVSGGIDKIEMSTAGNTDVLKIYGWAVVDGKESKLQKGYIVLKDTKGNRVVYDTFPFSSPIVADIFKSDLYMESGIYAAIPISKISEGEYEVYIYTENDGLYEMKVNKAVMVR